MLGAPWNDLAGDVSLGLCRSTETSPFKSSESCAAAVSRKPGLLGESHAANVGRFAWLPSPGFRGDPPPSGTGVRTRSQSWSSVTD